MQSTKLLQSPLSELSEEKKGIAYNLLNRLVDGAVDENYTMLDYMQMARLYYNLGELSNNKRTDEKRGNAKESGFMKPLGFQIITRRNAIFNTWH